MITNIIYSFEINKVNHFLALAATFPLIFLSNLFSTFEAKLLTNPGKLSQTKRIATLISAFFLPKLSNQEQKDPPDRIALDIWPY